jgi:CcmD family protein
MTLVRWMIRPIAIALLLAACWSVSAGAVQTQPPPSPAQEGFVPIDQLQPKEQLPAAPLLIAAYAVAWIAVFVYVWTIWSRLRQVEQDLAAVRQRLGSVSRR